MPAGPYLRDTNTGAWVLAGAIALGANAISTSLVWWDLSNPPGPGGAANQPGPVLRSRGGAPTQTIVSVEGTFALTFQVLISLADGLSALPPTTPAGAGTLPVPPLLSGSAPAWTYVPAGARWIAFNISAFTSGAANCWIGGALIGPGGGL